jgi:hypothetical protein
VEIEALTGDLDRSRCVVHRRLLEAFVAISSR